MEIVVPIKCEIYSFVQNWNDFFCIWYIDLDSQEDIYLFSQ